VTVDVARLLASLNNRHDDFAAAFDRARTEGNELVAAANAGAALAVRAVVHAIEDSTMTIEDV
jgi:hypothetical protein